MAAKSASLSRKAVLVKGALMTFLAPKLAQDAQIDLRPLIKDITNANFSASKPALLAGIALATKDKLAQDADISDLTNLVDALKDVEEEEGEIVGELGTVAGEAEEGVDAETEANAGPPDKGREFLAGKLSAEDMASYDALCAGKAEGMDEPAERDEMAERLKKGSPAKDAEEDKDKVKNMVTKGAMDQAIKAAVSANAESMRAQARAIREAEREVRPYIGEVTIAQDSAEALYKLALDHLGVDIKDVPSSAYRAVLKTQAVPGSASKKTVVAQDAAAATGFLSRFPEAARIGFRG